ncbi:MAG: hypothetical protein J7M26_09840, partial [Armatimonadetes bacterium]|nr:hypothetical protein [Armatimonadota bacterium]
WVGLEYPASRNKVAKGRVSLEHFPGRAPGREGLACKRAVMGVARPGQTIALAFEDYLNTVMLPPRVMLHYNSWYDLRGSELSPQRLLEVYAGYEKGLLEPYGLKLDSFAIDDGWQDRQSIWRPRKDLYPQGFGPLAKELEARGTRLGLWMPLSGFNLDVNWGARHGYEKSSAGRWYCLGGPRFYAAMRDATARLIREGNLSYYKHDFNMLRCSASGHQHLPDGAHGYEMNVDRTIALLQYEHQIQPGIFLNVTSGMWYSPWWLMYADSIWGAFPGDTGYDRAWPQLTRREWAMSFRDRHLYRMYCERPNNFVPISKLMTHGITQGRKNMLGGKDEPLREWADYVMMYFGRGVLLQELYLSPERMREDMWKAVGLAIRWAHKRQDVLARTWMVGGNPDEGKPFGYIHWLGDQGIWVLRNPDLREQELAVPVGQASGYRGKAQKLYGAVTYPYLAPLAKPIQPGRDYKIKLPPASVVVVEVRPRSWGEAPMPSAYRTRGSLTLHRQGDVIQARATAIVRARQFRNERLYVLLRGGLVGVAKVEAEKALATHTSSGPGWQLIALDFKPLTNRLQVTVTVPRATKRPFSSRHGELSVWLVYEVKAGRAELDNPPDDLPWALADGWRRHSLQLGHARFTSQGPTQTIAPDQLKQIKAAKLHLEVFGVNAGGFADKWILLNGQKIARVPFNNQSRLDRWEDKVIELTPDQVKTLREDNTVVLTNEPGDCYKVRNLALAVQLADGTWVESTWDEKVYCSVRGWLYSEGKFFSGNKSPVIHLRLRLKK